MAEKKVTVEEIWSTAAGHLHGRKVASAAALEMMAAQAGGKVGSVQPRHVGGQFTLYETTSDERRAPVGYECGHCNSIVVGPPVYRNPEEIVVMDESGSSAGAGVVASDIYCGRCDQIMYGKKD